MMDFSAFGRTEVALALILVVVLVACLAVYASRRKRRTATLRSQFGEAEYARTVKIDGSQRHAEAALEGRAQRVDGFHVRPLSTQDRLLYAESWRGVLAQFVDSPAGAVAEADRLLRDVMGSRGYPVSDFAQRAADLSVGYPLLVENYRTAHAIAMREGQGQATTEELRQAMVHYRTLFAELFSEPKIPAVGAGR